MIIRDIENDKIRFFTVEVNKDDLISIQKQELELLKTRLIYLAIRTSISDEEEFYKFLMRDTHEVKDYFFDQGYNSGSNQYMIMKKLFDDQEVEINDFYHTFKINLSENNSSIISDLELQSNEDSFYGIINSNKIISSGNWRCYAYPIIQISKSLFIIDKILKNKLDVIMNDFENDDYNRLLKLFEIKNIGQQSLKDIQMQFDSEDVYNEHIKEAVKTDKLVKILKKI